MQARTSWRARVRSIVRYHNESDFDLQGNGGGRGRFRFFAPDLLKAAEIADMLKKAKVSFQTQGAAAPRSVADASEEARQYTVRVNCR